MEACVRQARLLRQGLTLRNFNNLYSLTLLPLAFIYGMKKISPQTPEQYIIFIYSLASCIKPVFIKTPCLFK